MSGPVAHADAEGAPACGAPTGPTVEVLETRRSTVGSMEVRRALPRRGHRTVGAWCFADHMGPVPVTEEQGVDIGPHPHIGLQTVTWLVAGEILHRDSLGSEQLIRPGQLNLMTAGRGVAHAEEASGQYRGDLHGIQLWVAQPEGTRHGEPAFEHHAELPTVDLGTAIATVIVGALDGVASPARRDTDHTGVEVVLRPGTALVPVPAAHEHAVVVLDGAVCIDGTAVGPGQLGYVGAGRDELALSSADGTTARLLLLGGVPFGEEILMWWNFVARSRDEVAEAQRTWNTGDGARFGAVASDLARIEAPPLAWR